MATITLKISGQNNGVPTLQDENGNTVNGDIDCSTGDTIQWNINPNSGVSAICIKKTGGTDVFDGDLQQRGNSNNWYGVVANDTGGDEEDYSIAASACPEAKVWHDPKITVRAKK